ncbi:RHS repeat-associated core domain-containing protein [Stackebrandtia endophytica]|uniref:RHS repeat-associated core domain-containing protein n=1 Tax=Stackebrandtia endophytica TaxID=1496996 RepID=UPI0036384B54
MLLVERFHFAQRLVKVKLFMLCVALVAGMLVGIEIARIPTSPDDPDYGDPATGTVADVEPKQENGFTAAAPEVKWPSTEVRSVSAGPEPTAVTVGGLHMSMSAATDTTLTVETVGRDQVLDAGVSGTAVRITGEGDIDIELNYGSFTSGYGGDYGQRLRAYLADGCLDAVHSGCAVNVTPLSFHNDGEKQSLAGQLSLTGSTATVVLAAESDSSQGSFEATALSPSSSWAAGGSSGAFTWDYPIPIPTTVSTLRPDISLAYGSQGVDGRTASTNNQGSWIGEGFSYEPGYIERRYKSCQDDGHDTKYDQCWAWDNASIMLNGAASGELVKDGDRWRASTDDGSRIERLTGANNGDDNGEYWKLTTINGTQYFFGMNRLPGWSSGDATTNSAWTVPVFGDDSGEPCYNATLDDAHCDQAWRWNLDYVIDPLGNVITYHYAKENNRYAINADFDATGVEYTRGGYLKRIDYGQRESEVYSSTAPAQVVFTTTERCIPAAGISCAAGDLTDDTARNWPDVPFDRNCKADKPCNTSQASPSFWTRKRLVDISTQVYVDNTYRKVDSWQLRHNFVSNGDATRTLWLESITRTGHTGTTPITLPPTELLPVQKENRVDVIGDSISPLVRPRLATVYTDTGGQIDVIYSDQDCAPGDTPTPKSNSRLCYPVIWQPGSSQDNITDWFHKYVATEVIASDRTGASPDQTTRYQFSGGAKWRHAKPDGITKEEQLTWSDWRGYGKVTVIGAPDTAMATRTEYTYFRGMHGDDDGSGGTTTVDLTDSTGGIHRDYDELAGQTLETVTYNGDAMIGKTVSIPWRHETATRTHSWGTQTAAYVRADVTRTFTTLAAGGWRETFTGNRYDPELGRVIAVEDRGDISDPADNTCTRTWYADNTAEWMLAYPARVEAVAVDCDTSPDRSSQVISDVRNHYDGGSYQDVPVKGLLTTVENLVEHDGTNATYAVTGQSSHDAYGRITSVTDALGNVTATSYVDANGLLTSTVEVDPIGHSATLHTDPVRGTLTSTIDVNGKKTEYVYDALGRVVEVWLPFQRRGTVQLPYYVFEYRNSEDAPVAITTRKLNNNESAYTSAVSIVDGWLRDRQVQEQGPDGGRLITDVVHDAMGRVAKTNAVYYASGAPQQELLLVEDALVNGQTLTEFDRAGRITAQIFADAGTEKWRTTYVHEGDRVHTTPPSGATATTTITDARGQTTALLQYHGATPTGPHDTTTYTYTHAGQLASVTDTVGNTWAYTYDQQGRKILSDDPDTGISSFEYDAIGQLIASTDARGITVSTEYDELGRVIATWEGEPGTGTQLTKRTWDLYSKGQLALAYSYAEGLEFITKYGFRDWNYAPTGINYFIRGEAAGSLAGEYSTGMTYHRDGTPSTRSWGATVDLPTAGLSFKYDELARLTTIERGETQPLVDLSHTPVGLLLKGRYRMAATTATQTFQYEHGTNRLERVWLEKDDTAGTIADINYSYDSAGNVRSVIDNPSATGTARDAQCFEYDHLERMTRAWTTALPGTTASACDDGPLFTGVGGAAPYWYDYEFDETGNRTSVRHTTTGLQAAAATYDYPVPGGDGPHQVQAVNTPDGATTSYLYDAAGNTTSVDRNGDLQILTWDANGKLAEVSEGEEVTRFGYDADGNQVFRQDADGRTLFIDGMEVHEDTAGVVTCTRYIALPGGATMVETAAGTQWQFADHHGTATIGLDNNTGAVAHRYTDPFGSPRGSAPDQWAGQKGFVGGGLNPSTGYTTIGARQYDPVLGRFLSVDPIIDFTDPQQINGYAYGNNAPATRSDPTGLFSPPNSHDIPSYRPKQPDPSCQTGGAVIPDHCVGQPGSGPTRGPIKEHWNGPLYGVVDENGVQWINGIEVPVGLGTIEEIIDAIMEEYAHSGSAYTDLDEDGWMKQDVMVGYWGKLCEGGILGGSSCGTGTNGLLEEIHSAHRDLQAPMYGGPDGIGYDGMGVMPIKKVGAAGWGANRAWKRAACGNSFVPGTLVLMADGTTKPIEEVEVGDEVVSTDPGTGETGPQEVTATTDSNGGPTVELRDLVTISIDEDGDGTPDGDITATPGHAFWTADDPTGTNAQWTTARNLTASDWLRTGNGAWIQTGAATQVRETVATYNLSVLSFHTYHVTAGEISTMVHNCDLGPQWKARPTSEICGSFGCEKVAEKIKEKIGGEIVEISPLMGRYLPQYRGQDTLWQQHFVVVKNGRVYDAFGGRYGVPVSEYKALWQYNDVIDFGF